MNIAIISIIIVFYFIQTDISGRSTACSVQTVMTDDARDGSMSRDALSRGPMSRDTTMSRGPMSRDTSGKSRLVRSRHGATTNEAIDPAMTPVIGYV